MGALLLLCVKGRKEKNILLCAVLIYTYVSIKCLYSCQCPQPFDSADYIAACGPLSNLPLSQNVTIFIQTKRHLADNSCFERAVHPRALVSVYFKRYFFMTYISAFPHRGVPDVIPVIT